MVSQREVRFGLAAERRDCVLGLVITLAGKFPAVALCIEHLCVVLQQPGQFIPLLVRAGLTHSQGLLLQPFKQAYFGLEFGDCLGRRRLIDHPLFDIVQFRVRGILQFIQIVSRVFGKIRPEVRPDIRAAMQELLFTKPSLQPLPPALQRLIDDLGGRRQTPLKDLDASDRYRRGWRGSISP